ncbi:MAG: endolytic transglycosylase MltG, partial [Vicinamibacterales bacterium]
MRKSVKNWLLVLILVLAVAAVAGGYSAHRWYGRTPLISGDQPVRITVPQGSSLTGVARRMQMQGLLSFPRMFVVFARIEGHATRLHAGVYEIQPGMSASALVERIVRGDSIRDEIRFIEGWTFRQIRAALDAHAGLKHDSEGLSDSAILERVGAIEKHPEGLFFPDSYQFAAGSSDFSVLRMAYSKMKSTLETAWAERDRSVPLESPYDALILASIVEKETGHEADRARISAVFNNRLRIGMRLQSDPTVIYGLGTAFDGNLRRVDLERDSLYNTYTRGGLPPTPICSPGTASIRAALR